MEWTCHYDEHLNLAKGVVGRGEVDQATEKDAVRNAQLVKQFEILFVFMGKI